MAGLPPFTDDGLLPTADYELSLSDLKASALVLGSGVPRRSCSWDSDWREQLVDNLAVLVEQLWQVGVTEVFVDEP